MANNMKIFEQWESEVRAYCRAAPTVFKSASNATQVDENGKTYVDFFGGAGVLNFGHNNPKMKEAMIDFLKEDGVAHSLDMYTTAKRNFIEKFVNTILKPRKMNYKMQFTGPTGTNAVEAALKLARRVTGSDDVVAFTHGFHGMTLGSLACTANHYFRNASGVSLNNVIRWPFGTDDGCLDSLDELRNMFRDPASGVKAPAAFLVETIQAEGGVRVGNYEWLKGVQKLARELGALFIIDDIQVGCGRTGSYFSFDGTDLDPDIIVLAKGIGGYGTPLAMTLNKPEIDEKWSPGEHTGTFRGQGLSFVAGAKGLEYFDDNELMDKTKNQGKYMYDFLEELAAGRDDVKVRGRGMILGFDVTDGGKAKEIARECFENGMLIGVCGMRGEVLKFIPPLTIPEDDLKKGLNIFADAFRKIF